MVISYISSYNEEMKQTIEEILDTLIPSDEVWNQKHSVNAFISICEHIEKIRYKNASVLKSIYKSSSEAENIPQESKRKYLNFHEKFYGEILPLQKLITKKYLNNPDILVRYTGKTNVSYDAEVFNLSNASYVQRIEFTSVIDGKSVPAFKEHVKTFGYAPGLPTIPESIKPYNKNTGIQEQPVFASYSAGSREILCQHVEKTISNKINERYQGYWLAVVFNDFECALDDIPAYKLQGMEMFKPTNEYKESLRAVVEKLTPKLFSVFSRIFFIGSTCDYFDEIELTH